MPSTQYDRRQTPYATTWEIPAAVAGAVAFVTVIGLHLGRALATLIGAGQWTWPTNLFSGLLGVLQGHAAAGLDPHTAHRITSAHLAPALVQTITAVTTLTVVGATCGLGLWGWARLGPSRIKGMATRHETETTLGVTRLRAQRSVIRPDLYPRTTRPHLRLRRR